MSQSGVEIVGNLVYDLTFGRLGGQWDSPPEVFTMTGRDIRNPIFEMKSIPNKITLQVIGSIVKKQAKFSLQSSAERLNCFDPLADQKGHSEGP